MVKRSGITVTVTLEEDFEERVLELSEDIRVFFKKNVHAKEFFNTLSYTNQKEYVVWITSAKKQETRERRLLSMLKKLHDKKKNPSEK
ncbi:MAG: YdeI/OmpD-associated family protein [Bacteroidota bacterium]